MANFTELDRYLFGQATHYDIYRKLGAHFAEVKGVKGVYFDLWAPEMALDEKHRMRKEFS